MGTDEEQTPYSRDEGVECVYRDVDSRTRGTNEPVYLVMRNVVTVGPGNLQNKVIGPQARAISGAPRDNGNDSGACTLGRPSFLRAT